MLRCGNAFFAEALTAIQKSQRGRVEGNDNLENAVVSLRQRTGELAASNKELKHEIMQRMAVEEALRTSEQTANESLVQARHMQEELRHLSRQLLLAQEHERKKISRELHDVVAQTLAGINVRLAGLKLQPTARSRGLREKVLTAQRLVEKSVDIVHRFARDLRPAVLDDLGLAPALQTFAKTFTERTRIRVSFEIPAGLEKLDADARTVLYRVAEEALTDMERKAEVSRAEVKIQRLAGAVSMEIKDNGKGFQVEAAHGKRNKPPWLLAMRERVEMTGGTLSVDSAPGKETRLRVEIPHRRRTAKKFPPKLSGHATLKCS